MRSDLLAAAHLSYFEKSIFTRSCLVKTQQQALCWSQPEINLPKCIKFFLRGSTTQISPQCQQLRIFEVFVR